jgi:hypothetical protein
MSIARDRRWQNGRIDNAVGSGIVGLDGRWRLGMAHFDESGAEDFSGLAVDIEGTNFSFRGRGHDVAKDGCRLGALVGLAGRELRK